MGPPRDVVRPSSLAISTAALTRVRSEFADRPFTTAAALLTLGLFVYNLAPFDFVMTTDALHASFGRAHWSLMNARVSTVGTSPFAAIAYQLSGAGWFAVLGYLLALGGRERRLDSAMSLGAAMMDGLILVVLVEFMQLFTQSHTFDAASLLIRSLGVVLGGWCAVFLIDTLSWSAWRRRPSLAFPTGTLAILAAFQVGLLIAPCLNPVARSFPSDCPMAVQWVPFESHWNQSFPLAAAEVLSSLLIFGTLALTLRVLLRRIRAVHAKSWVIGTLTIVAITCESLRLATLGKPLDVTTLMLAWLSVILVERAWNALSGEFRIPNTDRDARLFSQNP